MDQEQRANTAATHLRNKIWNKQPQDEERTESISNTQIIPHTQAYNTQDITQEELDKIIKKLKRHTATGPDGLAIETIKELDDDNREKYLAALNNMAGRAHRRRANQSKSNAHT